MSTFRAVSAPGLTKSDLALLELGRVLQREGYRFITPTPATHAKVVARRDQARTIRDVFGWNLPFRLGDFSTEWVRLLEESGQLVDLGDGRGRSAVRFSSIGDALFVHSGFPTVAADSVFFGPDTYRFVRVLQALPGRSGRAIDVGAGSGAGLLSISERCDEVLLADLNPGALRFASINAALKGTRVEVHESNVLGSVSGSFDLIASNPPYLVDDSERTYRHGGRRGIELPARIVRESLDRLNPGGTLVLYTGTPIVEGRDLFLEAISPALTGFHGATRYEELDPDVFAEELERPAYADVERIAVVALFATRKSR